MPGVICYCNRINEVVFDDNLFYCPCGAIYWLEWDNETQQIIHLESIEEDQIYEKSYGL